MQKKRIQKLRRKLKEFSSKGAVVIGSATSKHMSRDYHYPFRQDSDFLYLTHSPLQNALLVVRADESKPILMAPKPTPTKLLWDGVHETLAQAARRIGAKAVASDTPLKDIHHYLNDIDLLAFQNAEGTLGWKLAQSLMNRPSHLRTTVPSTFIHSDKLLIDLRCYKDIEEIKALKKAGEITGQGLDALLAELKPGLKEYQVKAKLEYAYKMQGADFAFDTIAATGSSAAILHYSKHDKTLRKGDMILIDTGAKWQNYCADVSRTYPVSGKFTPEQTELYACVKEALRAATSKIKHNVKIAKVYDAAAKVLTQGLKDFGILKGSLDSLLERNAFKEYFPHGIGHTLGIDPHDIGNLRANNNGILKSGMVFTVEPGLYFRTKNNVFPACGVRIEDYVQVTKQGCKNLTAHISK